MPSGVYERQPPEIRFWHHVDKNGPIPARRPDLGPCWMWLGEKTEKGYGRFYINRKPMRAHRFLLPSIPEGMEPDHLCFNKGCVNPHHIEIVTTRVNTLRGGNPTAVNAAKTHCIHGHPFDLFNTIYLTKDDMVHRRCRLCKNLFHVELRKRRRQAVASLRLSPVSAAHDSGEGAEEPRTSGSHDAGARGPYPIKASSVEGWQGSNERSDGPEGRDGKQTE